MDPSTVSPQPLPTQPVMPVSPVPVPPKNNSLSVLVVIILLFALGAAGFFAYQNYQLKQQITLVQPTPTPIVTPIPTTDPTAAWKIFTDTHNGIEFKYPQDWYAKQMTGWTFNVFLNDHDFEIPTMTEFITPIQISFNEVMDTTTNIKRYSEKTIEEAAKRIKADIYGENVSETDNLIIGGHKAIQLVGTAGPGMLEGQYYKVTYIQMDNKVLTVALINNKSFETIYNQILSTFKFTQLQQTGFISGKLCYPADHVPSGIITAKNIDTGAMTTINYKWDGHSSDNPTYKIELKPGNYHVKYESVPDPGDATGPGTTYYTDLAKCTFVQGGCDSRFRPLLTATVIAGETLFGIHPCDINTSPNPPDF